VLRRPAAGGGGPSLGVAAGEDSHRDLIAVEGSGGAGVGLEVDEQVDDLIFGDAAVEGDPELPAEGLARPE
jgi:hypothetical protein